MKAPQRGYINKIVFGVSTATCGMPDARTSKSFVNERIHILSTETTALSSNTAVININ